MGEKKKEKERREARSPPSDILYGVLYFPYRSLGTTLFFHRGDMVSRPSLEKKG